MVENESLLFSTLCPLLLVSQIPNVPVFEVVNTMEHDIVIRWNWADQSAPLDSIHFRLNCGLDDTFVDIDIQSNEYRCQSLVSG